MDEAPAQENDDLSLEDQQEVNEDDIHEVVECETADGPSGNEDESMDEGSEDTEMNDDSHENENEQLPIDTSIARFDLHDEPVFCLAAHPINPHICASGGADDLGRIWNLSNGQEILKLEGHQDSLSTVEFSHDGLFLATGGVDATIKIWKTSDPKTFLRWEFLLNLEASEEVTWITWHPTKPVLLAGFSDGMMYMWQIPACSMRVFAGHDSMTTCGIFSPDGQKIVSSTESGKLFIWDPKTDKAEHIINLNAGRYAFKANDTEEKSGINSIAINQASKICIVGGISNGGVRIVNIRTGIVLAGLNEHQSGATVEVGFFEPDGPGLPLLISAGSDGLACIHDASSFKLRNSINHQDSITTFVVHKEAGLLTTGSADQTLSTWDLKTAQRLKVHSGHTDIIHVVKLTSDNKKLISCGDDGAILIFET